MVETEFAGAVKSNRSILSPLERRFSEWAVPRLPAWLETYHLTMMTVIWCALILLGGYLARNDIRWLWLVSASVAGQYITDHLDGKLGKFRKTGLVRWGYFMDHLLDYFFLSAILASYLFVLPGPDRTGMFPVFVVFGGYLVLTYLATASTGRFRIAAVGLGPTEFRIAIIVINVLLIRYGTRTMAAALPWVAGGAFVLLVWMAYRTHREVWDLDMARARNQR